MRINYLVVNLMKTVKLIIPCCSLVLKPLTVAGKKTTQTNIDIQGWKAYNWDSERLEPAPPRPWSDALTARPSQHDVDTLNLND